MKKGKSTIVKFEKLEKEELYNVQGGNKNNQGSINSLINNVVSRLFGD